MKDNTFDVICVLGNGFTKDWDLPPHVKKRLDEVSELVKNNVAKKIIISGKWSLIYDHESVIPPITEAGRMKEYFIQKGVNQNCIIKEEKSKDTIGNLYYLKKILTKRKYKKVLIAISDFHLKRVRFLVNKIFGDAFRVDFYITKTHLHKLPRVEESEKRSLGWQKEFLKPMSRGDHTFLHRKFYSHNFFKIKRPAHQTFLQKGEV